MLHPPWPPRDDRQNIRLPRRPRAPETARCQSSRVPPRPAVDQRQPAQHGFGLTELLVSCRANVGGRERGSRLLAARFPGARILSTSGYRVGILQSAAEIGLTPPVSLGKFRQLQGHYREIGSETLALNTLAARRHEPGGGEPDGAVSLKRNEAFDRALAKAPRPDQNRPPIVLQPGGD